MRDHVRLATKPRRWQHPGEMPTEECIVWGIAERWAAPGLALLAAALAANLLMANLDGVEQARVKPKLVDND